MLDFTKLLRLFPTKTTLDHFANSRISGVLKDYLSTITDAQKKLEEHFARQAKLAKSIKVKDKLKPRIKVELLREYEIGKYRYILESVKEMLANQEEYSEGDWQEKMLDFILLIFPKYITVLKNVHIKDFYSKSPKSTNRFIDFALIDANGNIDIIEIKKPFESCLLYSSKYRDNYIPKKELSGAVMQIEKYLFHLNKWGINGEKKINAKRSSELPNGICNCSKYSSINSFM